MIILNRIKQLRNEKGINQSVLAKVLNIEIAGISKLETGRVPLKDDYIITLADYFNVSTDYLLCQSDIRKPKEASFRKEIEGMTDDEILDALKLYKEMKKRYGSEK